MKNNLIMNLVAGMAFLILNTSIAQTAIDPATGSVVPWVTLGSNYQLAFSDEFNDNTIDPSKWTVNVSSSSRAGRPDLSISDWWWVSDNAYEQNGSLVLDVDKFDANTMHCGSINSQGKFEQTYGYFEAKIKIADASKGTHTAFWFQGDNQGNVDDSGQDGAEIDVFESAWLQDYTKSVVHIDGYGTDHQSNTKQYNTPNIHDGNYHIWGFLWEADKLSIYYDGVLSVTYTDTKWIPQVNEFIWLSDGASFGIAGDYFTSQPIGNLTSAYVDYIRVWKQNQSLTWTGIADSDFYNEQNWQYTGTAITPTDGTLTANTTIEYNLVVTDATIDISGTGLLTFSSTSKGIQLQNSKFTCDGLETGIISLDNSSTLILNSSTPIGSQSIIDIMDAKSWVKLIAVEPNVADANYLDKIQSNGNALTLGTNVRINQYYFKGSLVRLIDTNFSPIEIYSDIDLGGSSQVFSEFVIHSGSDLGPIDNAASSFRLERGYVATLAASEDGKGKSAVFIANEETLNLNLSAELDNQVSFIRVMPWNWVNKKGAAWFTEGLNVSWTYQWNNTLNSLPNMEYVPMSWGGNGASLTSVAEQIQKRNVTHMLGFNESDNCEDQSGQYAVDGGDKLCVITTAVPRYENLMGTGLRLVSPSPREGGPFGWLSDFRDLADQTDVRMDVIGVHWYDWAGSPASTPYADAQSVFNRFKTFLTNVYNEYQKPIWITEFNANPNRDSTVQIAFIKLALPYLESLDYVERYCFYEPNKNLSIANGVNPTTYYDDNNVLTGFGHIYSSIESTPSVAAASVYSSGNVVIVVDENPVSNGQLYWSEYQTDTNGDPVLGDLPIIEKADANNLSTNYIDWVRTGHATQYLNSVDGTLSVSGYPNNTAGRTFFSSPSAAGNVNSYKNGQYDRRLGNVPGPQTIYLSLVMNVEEFSETAPVFTSFPIGFSYTTGEVSTFSSTWTSKLLIKHLGTTLSSKDETFQLGIDKKIGTTGFNFTKEFGADIYTANGNGTGDEQIFVVMKYTLLDGIDNDIIEMYSSTTMPTTEPTTWSVTVSTGTDFDVNAVFFREKFDKGANATTAPQAIDHIVNLYGIRVGDSWNALFPKTTYSATTWSNGIPDASTDAIVQSNLVADSDMIVNNLEIKAGVTLTINAGATLDIKGNLTNNGNLIVESGGSLLGYEINTLGPVTAKRNSSFEDIDLRYSFIGSPVSGFDISGLASGYHYTYNSLDDSYSEFSGVMVPGVGYTSAGKKALEFDGIPNTGTVTVPLNNAGNKFNFVSNPYTAAINRASFIAGNPAINGAIYLWDDGGSNTGQRSSTDFVTVANAGVVSAGSSGSGATFDENTAIGTAQGFLIQGNTASNVTFTETMREVGNNADANYFRKADLMRRVKLELTGYIGSDQTLIAFSEEGTWSFDRMWDATKMLADEKTAIYTFMGDEKLAIQTLPNLESMTSPINIPLGIKVDIDEIFNLKTREVSLPEDYYVVLFDHLTDEKILLGDEGIDIYLNTQDQKRFSIQITNKSNVLATENYPQKLIVFVTDDQLNLRIGSISGAVEMVMFDLGGRLHSRANLNFDTHGRAAYQLQTLPHGIYIVKINQGSTIFTTKFYY